MYSSLSPLKIKERLVEWAQYYLAPTSWWKINEKNTLVYTTHRERSNVVLHCELSLIWKFIVVFCFCRYWVFERLAYRIHSCIKSLLLCVFACLCFTEKTREVRETAHIGRVYMWKRECVCVCVRCNLSSNRSFFEGILDRLDSFYTYFVTVINWV